MILAYILGGVAIYCFIGGITARIASLMIKDSKDEDLSIMYGCAWFISIPSYIGWKIVGLLMKSK
jgi:hypothetical protein